ncbi:hypothetical protein FEM48_Zijuj06G0212800 [Ziziphus jujuba var. spinosa]|uniref:Uncharacterized protein n=1 Tax=Ziziphus jujuba var. spinosa TaxID=714518 RepID=A0A978VBP0_ZIZJJ|nr:hypothetical protein FEM48_Zijuj06G0212800 [Ziziphus jujuba var. spinosa]
MGGSGVKAQFSSLSKKHRSFSSAHSISFCWNMLSSIVFRSNGQLGERNIPDHKQMYPELYYCFLFSAKMSCLYRLHFIVIKRPISICRLVLHYEALKLKPAHHLQRPAAQLTPSVSNSAASI